MAFYQKEKSKSAHDLDSLLAIINEDAKCSLQTDDAKHWYFDAAEWINFIITILLMEAVHKFELKFLPQKQWNFEKNYI